LPAVLTSAILLTQPVMTVLFAALLLGEAPSSGQVLGVVLVVVGLALATGAVGRVRDDLRETFAPAG
jgi:drug/metabolite transporter (DMT)-like permease